MPEPRGTYTTCLRSIDELLEQDKQREKDGFPRKIRVGRLIKPGKGGKDKIVVVPTTVEEKFIHDSIHSPEEEGEAGGSGEGEEGEVIGEEAVRTPQGAEPVTVKGRAVLMKWNQVLMTWESSLQKNLSFRISKTKGKNDL